MPTCPSPVTLAIVLSSCAPRLLERVETLGAARQDLPLRLRRQLRPIRDQLRSAGEEAVGMRIVGRPQDLVWPDVVREDAEAALHGLERDPAVALEQLARARGEIRVVEALVVEVTIHAVEPGGDPSAPRLQESDADLRVLVAHALPDDAHGRQHHLEGVGDDVARAPRGEAIDANLRHTAARALVEADGEVELL